MIRKIFHTIKQQFQSELKVVVLLNPSPPLPVIDTHRDMKDID